MEIIVANDPVELGKSAAVFAANILKQSLEQSESVNIVLATGASQFETIAHLLKEDIDWSRVTMFHLDEYIELSEQSPASFRRYLKERFINKLSTPLKSVYLINTENEPAAECQRLNEIIRKHPIDLAFVGIGENGHLAFNDPPADFVTEDPYIIVDLDEHCRKQQFGEGWFKTLDDVPRQAISMSIKQIMKSKHIICSVPDGRKANAVKNSLQNPVSNMNPASILQLHPNCVCFLDKFSSELLT